MDRVTFDTPKPPRDWDERIQKTKEQLGHAATTASVNLGVVGGKLKVHGGAAAVVIGEKAGTLKQRL